VPTQIFSYAPTIHGDSEPQDEQSTLSEHQGIEQDERWLQITVAGVSSGTSITMRSNANKTND
jgi:hypothetical protein